MEDDTRLRRGMFKDLGRKPKARPTGVNTDDYDDESEKLDMITVDGDDIAVYNPKVRLQVFVTKDTHEFLKKEAARSATTVSALCSIAIQDMVDQRKRRGNYVRLEDMSPKLRAQVERDLNGGSVAPR